MSKRKRNEIEDLAVPVKEVSGEPKMPFTVWFDKMLSAGRVKFYQDEALLVFFKKQGLKNAEIETTYNKAFENF